MWSTAAIRAVARRSPNVILKRNFHYETYVSGPPRVRIPLGEKMAHGLFIWACMLATPMYVLSHIKDWRPPEEPADDE